MHLPLRLYGRLIAPAALAGLLLPLAPAQAAEADAASAAANHALVQCVAEAIPRLDDRVSDAMTIARAALSQCDGALQALVATAPPGVDRSAAYDGLRAKLPDTIAAQVLMRRTAP